MIVVSLVLILASGGLLVGGIVRGEDSLVIGSMVVSLLAAVALFAGIRRQRQALARRVTPDSTPTRFGSTAYGAEGAPTEALPVPVTAPAALDGSTLDGSTLDGSAIDRPALDRSLADTAVLGTAAEQEPDGRADEGPLDDPPDEPPAELLMASEVSRIAQLDTEVLVVDGRPRYHLADCPHLRGRAAQGLPASEAIELGFTACGMCAAATTLLAQTTSS